MPFVFMKAVAMECVMVPNEQLAGCHGNAATLAAVSRSPSLPPLQSETAHVVLSLCFPLGMLPFTEHRAGLRPWISAVD